MTLSEGLSPRKPHFPLGESCALGRLLRISCLHVKPIARSLSLAWGALSSINIRTLCPAHETPGGLGWVGRGGSILPRIPPLAEEAAEVTQRGTQGHMETARSHRIPALVALHWLCCPLLQTLASLKCPTQLPGGHRLLPVLSSLLVVSQEEQTRK